MTFRIDDRWIRPHNRQLLLAGSPLSLSRVTGAGVGILDALESTAPLPPGHEPLTDRLVLSGSIHRDPTGTVTPDDITVVIPAFINSDVKVQQLTSLVQQLAPLHVIVIDDASPVQYSIAGCDTMRLDTNGGPAHARNIGAARATTPIIAFVDVDASISGEDICALARHVHPGETSIVAPRVTSAKSRGFLARYESLASPLDMGTHTTRVRVGARVPYVPSTCLVVTIDSFRTLNGFDDSMRFGEDVDFIWRAVAQGIGVKYVADIAATHEPRRNIARWLRQRYSYGTSAAPLVRRHGSIAAPYRGDLFVAAAWLVSALGFWQVGAPALALVIAVAVAQLSRKGVGIVTATKVACRSTFQAGRHLAFAATRPWLVPLLIGAWFNHHVALAVTIAFVAPALVDYVRRPRTDPLSFVVLRVLDHASYGAGVLVAAVRRYSPTAMLPSLTVRR